MITQEFTMKAADAKSLVRRLKKFVSTDAVREMLTGIHLFERDDELWVEATDSYRLIRFNLGIQAPAKMFSTIVPFKFLEAAVKTATTSVVFTFEGVVLTIDSLSLRSSCNLIQGDYPSVSRIIDDMKPLDEPITPGGFNPTYMRDLAAALIEWTKDDAAIQIVQMHELKPLVIEMTGQHGGHAVLMPQRVH